MNDPSLALRLTEAEQGLLRTQGQIDRQHNWITKLDQGGRTSVAERQVLNTLRASHGTFVIERDRLLERIGH